ncbi:MAG: hypothetical protein KDF57_14410, partial [Ottowia sp.]|nr:hypothetical protein [Ottowia sp.]
MQRLDSSQTPAYRLMAVRALDGDCCLQPSSLETRRLFRMASSHGAFEEGDEANPARCRHANVLTPVRNASVRHRR